MKVRLPDGRIVHQKRPNYPLMIACEVEPDKLYLYRNSGYNTDWTLVKVMCVKEPGWLRGHVNVRGFFTNGWGNWGAWATLEDVRTGKHFDVQVERSAFKQEWTFCDDRKATLIPAPADYLARQVAALRSEAERLAVQAQAQLALASRFETLEHA